MARAQYYLGRLEQLSAPNLRLEPRNSAEFTLECKPELAAETLSSIDSVLTHPSRAVYTTFSVEQSEVEIARWHIRGFHYHIERLGLNAKEMNLVTPSAEEINSHVIFCIHTFLSSSVAADPPNGNLRVRVKISKEKGLEIFVDNFSSPWLTRESVSLTVLNAGRVYPYIKHCFLGISKHARSFAESQGYDEALLVGPDALILEGAWSNIFWFDKKSGWHTNLHQALPGVTQRILMQALDATPKRITLDELCQSAAEIFLTSSLSGVTSVNKIDAFLLPDSRPETALVRAMLPSLHTIELPLP